MGANGVQIWHLLRLPALKIKWIWNSRKGLYVNLKQISCGSVRLNHNKRPNYQSSFCFFAETLKSFLFILVCWHYSIQAGRSSDVAIKLKSISLSMTIGEIQRQNNILFIWWLTMRIAEPSTFRSFLFKTNSSVIKVS